MLTSTDPFNCLRICAISIGVWSLVQVYSVLQFWLLGWQIQVVKQIQWEYENRYLPATGAIDQFQARFPGLYNMYTETPDRRRINAMFAIVLICLGLNVAYLAFSAGMLYGAIKRRVSWILPWLFVSVPNILMCTTYSVLWWSGDVFNENLTFSVAEFVMCLALNGVCFVVVLLYCLRLKGQLSGELPPEGNNGRRRGRDPPSRVAEQRRIPSWNYQMPPDEPPPCIQRKLRRQERRSRSNPKAIRRGQYEEEEGRIHLNGEWQPRQNRCSRSQPPPIAAAYAAGLQQPAATYHR